MKYNILFKILKILFIFLLLATAIGKLLDNRGFAEVILTYQFGIPFELALPLGLFVSLFELALALALILNINHRRNGFLLTLMHVGYTGLAVTALSRGLNLTNCGCFGVFWQRTLTWQTVFEDLFLTAISFLFFWLASNKNLPNSKT